LESVQGRVIVQPGCLSCRIYEERNREHAVVLVQRWRSRGSLDTHLRSEMFRRILSAVELSIAPPEISFEHVSSSEGIELIERSRARDVH
jgi:quinol monooxygenase YgiN